MFVITIALVKVDMQLTVESFLCTQLLSPDLLAVSHVMWLLAYDPQMFQHSRLCKRARYEVSTDDSSYHLDVTDHELYKVKDLVHKTASVSII